MEKFTNLNSTNNSSKLEKSKTKKELISNIVEESLRIENGVIVGKDILTETFNKMIEMNDHKTTIQVLESIKSLSYKSGFNFKMINEAIENEKVLLNQKPIVENVEDDTTETVELLNEGVSSFLKNVISKLGLKFSVKSEDVAEEIKNDEVGENTKKLIDELAVAVDKVKESEKVTESLINESAEWDVLFQSILGAGGIILASAAITKLLTGLENGKYGEKGKKISKVLGELADAKDNTVVIGKDTKKDEIKESIFLDKYVDNNTIELDNLNSLYEQIKNTK